MDIEEAERTFLGILVIATTVVIIALFLYLIYYCLTRPVTDDRTPPFWCGLVFCDDRQGQTKLCWCFDCGTPQALMEIGGSPTTLAASTSFNTPCGSNSHTPMAGAYSSSAFEDFKTPFGTDISSADEAPCSSGNVMAFKKKKPRTPPSDLQVDFEVVQTDSEVIAEHGVLKPDPESSPDGPLKIQVSASIEPTAVQGAEVALKPEEEGQATSAAESKTLPRKEEIIELKSETIQTLNSDIAEDRV